MSFVRGLIVHENDPYRVTSVPHDNCTEDHTLKLKARSLNLIKYNPNLFTNRENGGFYYMVGGDPTMLTTIGCGVIAMLYRRKVNQLRQVPLREGIWYNTLFFLYGLSIGAFYSLIYFTRTQVLFNEIFAHYLMNRYKESKHLNRRNIYRLKDIENTDECYHFTSSFINNFHM
jgi:hypothetical protein